MENNPDLQTGDVAMDATSSSSYESHDDWSVDENAPSSAVSTNEFAAIRDNEVTAGTDLNLTAEAIANSTTANAGSTNGPAMAVAENTTAAGVIEAPINSGTSLSLISKEESALSAEALTTNGDAHAASLNGSDAPVGAVVNSDLTSGSSLNALAGTENISAALARSINGIANASATSFGTYGVGNSDLVAGTSLNGQVSVRDSLSSTAQSVSSGAYEAGVEEKSSSEKNNSDENSNSDYGYASEGSESNDSEGNGITAIASTLRGELSGIQAETIRAGTDLGLDVTAGANSTTPGAANRAASNAIAVSGDADALTDVERNTGISATSITTGGNGLINASVANEFQAWAETVSGNANAVMQTENTLGINVSQVGIHQNGNLSGAVRNRYLVESSDQAPIPVAQAFTISGDASATSSNGRLSGVDVGSAQIGLSGTVQGSARNAQSSVAQTTSGSAAALALVEEMQGVRAGSEEESSDNDKAPLFFGENGDVAAGAEAIGGATANTTTGDANAEVSQKLVQGLTSPVVQTGQNLGVQAEAINGQVARANNTSGDASATAASNDTMTQGVANSMLIAGLDSTGITGNAVLSSSAVASTVTGDASATNGYEPDAGYESDAGYEPDASDKPSEQLDSTTAGISGSSVDVGRNAINGMRFEGKSTANSTAQSVTGNATASRNEAIYGSTNTSVRVGDSILSNNGGVGTATFVASGDTKSQAATTTGDALANTTVIGAGFNNGTFAVHRDGNINASSVLVGTAVADQVSSAEMSDGDYKEYSNKETSTEEASARANVTLTSAGLNNEALDEHAKDVVIGNTGNVIGQSKTGGNSTANSVNGGVEATGNVNSQGINLAGGIQIGSNGSVVGRSFVGEWAQDSYGYTVPAASSQFITLANTTNGQADANSSFNSVGLEGNGTTVTAGPLGGGIEGRGLAAASTDANSVSGATYANNNASVIGIRNADLYGGQANNVNSNGIFGEARGTFDTRAMTTTGDAISESIVNGGGILGENNLLRVNGTLSAVSEFSNTVMASTVSGIASANAITDAVGIRGYRINLLENGNINATVNTSAAANAQNVNGLTSSYSS